MKYNLVLLWMFVVFIVEIYEHGRLLFEDKKAFNWVTPIPKVCKANGGRVIAGICGAMVEDAKEICYVSGARLPTIYEFRKLTVDCGGSIDDETNIKNISYISCLKRQGFKGSAFWSSSRFIALPLLRWNYGVIQGRDGAGFSSQVMGVRCIK